MPKLNRLVCKDEVDDHTFEKATAEELLTSSIDSLAMQRERKQVAIMCSASFIPISTLVKQQKGTSCVLGNPWDRKDNETYCLHECIKDALQVTRDGKKVLFLVRDPKSVTKRLAVAVSNPAAAMSTEIAAKCLHHVHFCQCRSIYELLCELDHVEKSWRAVEDTQKIELVVLGPLCVLFASFQTVSGMTVIGSGLKRMVELAIKRLQTMKRIHVRIIRSKSS
ncbi:unnamed protein product [Peronospora belbahrii]|uniref:Uncharacterized protein n=1 Tax=Peronospora belbahrii TaxID=622444 RepID=A0AAU9KNA4_9STRA|nr:unnamed protein product [Peronospora belbahrii]CAH0517610.1 unnamed protein product [Peronospora belbahrii]